MFNMDVVISSGIADDDTTATGTEEDCTIRLLVFEWVLLVVEGVGEGIVT